MDDLIYAYTRAEALADGVLVDVSEAAREAGIRYPVAVTRSVWCRYVEVPRDLEGLQDESGRLWDVLWLLRFAVRRAPGREVRYQVRVQQVRGRRPRVITLKAVCGPGDHGEPVITIMLPEED